MDAFHAIRSLVPASLADVRRKMRDNRGSKAVLFSFPTFVATVSTLRRRLLPLPETQEEEEEPKSNPEPIIGLDSTDAEAWGLLKEYGWDTDSEVSRWLDDGGSMGPWD